jgi:hypothetical protein
MYGESREHDDVLMIDMAVMSCGNDVPAAER